MSLEGKKLVLGITGSIAAYKAADLVRQLVKAGAEVQPVMTASAARFIPPLTIATLAKREVLGELFPDAGQAQAAWTRHVDLGLWADGVVIAPATAQTLAKLAGGFCDSMLTALVLSARCPVMVAPAMDHDMWGHPATRRNVATLQADGIEVVSPAHGELASGLVGDGRLPEPAALAEAIDQWLGGADEGQPAAEHDRQSLAGRHVLVTAGPTREAIDPGPVPVERLDGHDGLRDRRRRRPPRRPGDAAGRPGSVWRTPPGVDRIDIVTAGDLLEAALAQADAELVIAAAAVSDYAPVQASDRKLKKADDALTISLRRTPDVLASLGERKRDGQTLVGFALETHDGQAHAQGKLERKNLDWIALNSASEPGAGFGTGTNRLTLLSASGDRVEIPLGPKRDVAEALLDAVT